MAAQTTRAIVVTQTGGPDVLEVQTREVADPGPGELLVRVTAAGVNFVDIYQREGRYPMRTPYVMGSEGAGVVEAVGDGVAGTAVGDRVAWPQTLGSASGLTVIAEPETVPVPEAVSLETAAALMLQGMTAHYLVNDTYPVRAGDTVLVHAAAGGVGQLLVQLAKAKGARVIATVSTDAKAAKVRALGADEIIEYSQVPDLAAAVRELTDGEGVAAVYDGVGRATFDASLAALRRRGMLVLFGAASGPVPPVDPQRLNSGGSLFLTRPTLKDYIASREELLMRGTGMLGLVADGTLRLEIGGRYPFTEARQAYADLSARRTTGKLLLIP